MSNNKKKFPALAGLLMLFLLAGAISCKGFFVNSPDSLTISPDPVTFSSVGDVEQLTAQATFGTQTQDVTTATVWKSANGCAVAPSTTNIGQMTAIGTGSSVTLTATYNGVSDTVSATLPTGISISPCGTSGKFSSGGTQTFTATSGGTDVTSTSTWTSSNTTIVKFASSSNSTATFGPTTGTAVVTASDGTDTGQLQVTVQ
jgi:hypothetical protein